MMMNSSNITAHDLLIDHPFSGIQLVTPASDHDHGHGGHYCHNWVSHHHQYDLDDQHSNHKQVGSDHDGLLNNQALDAEKGIETWTWEHNDDLYCDPMVGSVDIDSDDIHDNWLPNSSKLKVVKKMNPKRAASNSNTSPPMEIATDEYFPYFLQADHQNDSNSNNSGSNGNHNNNGIRVCSDCHTTKTPLWRSGPKGPKSLCNACGIRQRKARRALAAAAAAGGGGSDNNALAKATKTSTPKSLKKKISTDHNMTKEKKTSTTCGHDDTAQGWQQPYKKRLKHYSHHYNQNSYTSASQDSNGGDDDRSGERNDSKRMCFEEFITISLSKNAALHRVFPQDEKEAAILLMAMSCGLVHN